MDNNLVLGCDVGTGSVRVGLFDRSGSMITQKKQDIKIWRPQPNFVEQSSEDIWNAFRLCVTAILGDTGIDASRIKGLGFDATCSLVVLGENDKPVSVSPTGKDEQNIIVWMDHRAIKEANEINRKGHDVLKYVGGTISPEMQSPKLLWLKRNMPGAWNNARKYFDLSDYLVYRATGRDVRSVCSTTCKWTYQAHEDSNNEESVGRWDDSFFKETGLSELVDERYERIGSQIRPVGEAVGDGLTEKAADELGLSVNTRVGVGIIDAHAGGLGLLGMETPGGGSLENMLALIGGTSSCHMAVSPNPRFVQGVWGPYFSAMIPDMWLNEGGQSATGALIDHIIFSSEHASKLSDIAGSKNQSVYQVLNDRLEQLARENDLADPGMLTNELHLLPYFHGNRSPRSNPSLRGSICGLRLSSTIDDLALVYLAAIQGVAYGTRHIIEVLNENGYAINTIAATGGGTKNDLFLQQHADITGCHIVLAKEPETVLLGSAILGSVAAGFYPDVVDAMGHMNQRGKVINPQRGETEDYHDRKYRVFKKMYEDEVSYSDIMNG